MRKRQWRSGLKKAVCSALSVALASTIAIPVAAAQEVGDGFVAARVGGQVGPGLSTQASGAWSVPGAATAVDPDIITVGAHGSATTFADMLGLNDTVWTVDSSNPTTLAQAKANDRLGVFGSSANKSPNPYLANMFYNFSASGKAKASSSQVAVAGAKVASAEYLFNVGTEDGLGTAADLAQRPDIVVGISGAPGTLSGSGVKIMDHETTTARNYATWGSGNTIPSQAYNWVLLIRKWTDEAALAGTLNSDGNTYEKSSYYRTGDNEYDPVGVLYNDGTSDSGIAFSVRNMDALAWASEYVMQQDSAKKARYDDPLAIARKYEQYALATKWYVKSKVDSGQAAKKTVAVVSEVTSDNQFVLVKLNPDENADSLGTMSMAEAVQDTVNDLAATVAPNARVGAKNKSTTVDASTLMGADVVIGLPPLYDGLNATAENIEAALKAAGKADTDPSWPVIVNNGVPDGTFASYSGLGSSPEAALLVGYAQGMVYPDLVNPVDMMTYFASELYHLNDASVGPFVKSELSKSTLPSGVTLDGVSYSADDVQAVVKSVQAKLDEGTKYYYAHKNTIDNERPKIASTDLLDDANGYGTTSVSISAPSGAQVSVVDKHGIVVKPMNGVYVLENDGESVSTITVSLAGYRDYVTSYTTGSSVSITSADMTPAKSVAFTVPDGASLIVREADGTRVEPSLDGKYRLDANARASFTVILSGYRQYRGTVNPEETSVEVGLSDLTPLVTNTTFVVPSNSKLTVKDSKGAAVKANSDGTYPLAQGETYTVSLSLAGYAAYTKEVVGGSAEKVSIYRSMLGRTALTLNKATVKASDISAVDAAAVTSITLGSKVKKVSASAFAKCAKLTKVTGGANVSSIGATAFKGCSKLTSVALGSKLTTIGKSAFSGAKKLTTLTVKSKKLTKKGVKGSLTGSSVKTVKVSVGNASANKTYVAKYKTCFAKSNSGKSVTVK